MDEDRRYAILCGVVALAVASVVVMFASFVHGYRLSALVRMDPADEIAFVASEYDPDFAFVSGGHYDGVYAYAIAIDPFATRQEHEMIDYASYRYGRAAYGWMARLLSFGQEKWIPAALVGLNVFGLALGAYGASRLAVRVGLPASSGLFVALHPGLLVGTSLDTSEPISIPFVVAALLCWFNRRYIWAIVCMIVLCLIKEMFIAIPLGLMVWELVHPLRSRTPVPWTRIALLPASLIPLVGWWIYLRDVFDEWPVNQPWLIEKVGMGFPDTALRAAQDAAKGYLDAQVGIVALALVVAGGAAFLIGAVRAASVRTPFDAIFLFFFSIVSILSWWQLLFPKEFMRILSIPFLFLALVLARAKVRIPEPEVSAHA